MAIADLIGIKAIRLYFWTYTIMTMTIIMMMIITTITIMTSLSRKTAFG